jgi:hypothetical protein
MIMKKIALLLVFMMSVLAAHAQADTTYSKNKASKETTVKVSDLPAAVTATISKDYPGYTVKEASSTWENNALNYHVLVAKGTETETLVFDKEGKFLKKLEK